MLVIILAGVKAAADIVVPFLLAVFLAMVLNPLVAAGTPTGAAHPWVTLLVTAVIVVVMLFIGMLGASLNEFAVRCRSTAAIEKLRELQYYADRFNISLSSEAMLHMSIPARR